MKSHPTPPASWPASCLIRSRVSRLLALASLACALGISSAHAKNWYVSPPPLGVNNNSSGQGESATKPFATIQQAHDKTNPGDTVFIMPGTYGPFSITRGGTSESTRITYKNYSSNKPIIFFTGYTGISIGNSDTNPYATAYVTIEGIRVQGNADNITYAQAKAAYDRRLAGGGFEAAYNGHGINIVGSTSKVVHHIDVRDCEVWDAPASGIAAQYADYLKIEGNDVHENCFYNYYGTSGINMYRLKSSDGAPGITTYIRRNKSWGNWSFIAWIGAPGGNRITDGNGLILDFLDATGYSGKVRVENNVFYRNGGRGINLTESSGVKIVHNTSYNNGKSESIGSEFLIGSDSDATELSNNIFVNVNGEKLLLANDNCTGAIFVNNIFWNGTNGGVRDRTSPTDIIADPKFRNVTNSEFQLTGASAPAINAAASTLTTVDHDNYARGVSRDIGAYEFR